MLSVWALRVFSMHLHFSECVLSLCSVGVWATAQSISGQTLCVFSVFSAYVCSVASEILLYVGVGVCACVRLLTMFEAKECML